MSTRVSQRVVSVLAIVLWLFGAKAVSANPKSNLSGRWTVNVEKSDFGMLFAPKTANVKITHKGSSLRLVVSETNEQDETSQKQSIYSIGGKETVGALIAMPFAVTGVLSWKNGALRFDGTGSNSGVNFHVQETWTVSDDGKTITINRHFTSNRGNTDQKIVLEK